MLSYVYLAVGSLALGILITFLMLFLCQFFGIDDCDTDHPGDSPEYLVY
jgi:hypothetical protein